MKQTDVQSTLDGEIKTVMSGFCVMARSIGVSTAERAATVHLVAAAAYLEETLGSARTKQILTAAIAAIGIALN